MFFARIVYAKARTRALQRTAPGRLRVSRLLLPADPPRSSRATLRRPSAVSELESFCQEMLFLTQHHVDERRARGFDESNLYSEPSEDRLQQAKEIAGEIERAFLGIKLGNGVGLFEGQSIDDYESEEERGRKRAKDEKEDWRQIESKHLNACHSSLSFFDALGMRFHLPAFICCELRGEYRMGLDISLSDLNDWKRSKFVLLSSAQKVAVAKFLEFLSEDVDSEFSRPAIERDLIEFWLDGHQSKAEQDGGGQPATRSDSK